MHINSVYLENFRAFDELKVEFNERFNVLIGGNGSGKTALLEALCVGLGSFFLGIDDGKDCPIQANDIRQIQYEHTAELQLPVKVKCEGEIAGKKLSWQRDLTMKTGETTSDNERVVKEWANELQKAIRAGENRDLPVIVYFPSDRFWKGKSDETLVKKGSRLRGYWDVFAPHTNYLFFLNWARMMAFVGLQEKQESVESKVISDAVSNCIEDCKRIYFDVRETELMMEFDNGLKMPFGNLSSGYRNILAMVANIAFRCMLLNPHLRGEAASKSKGLVLIDDIDLHLHPSWQYQIVNALKNTFPNIQFIVTTHSPLVIASADKGEVIRIPENEYDAVIEPFEKSFKGWQLNYILEDLMVTMGYQANIGDLLHTLNQSIKKGDMETYNAKIEELETILHPNDSVLTVYKMKKGELILNTI